MRDIWGLGVESGGVLWWGFGWFFGGWWMGVVVDGGGGGVDMSFDFVVGCSWWL